MDRAQLPFQAAGLDVPSYVTNGNHDGLVQGNEDGQRRLRGHRHRAASRRSARRRSYTGARPDRAAVAVLGLHARAARPGAAVRRQAPDQGDYAANGADNAHGYDFVDEDENAASNFSASYYAWDPPEAPGFRFISIDTLSEGGIVEQSSNGNIDDPQFQWLERELQFAAGATTS